MEGGHVKSLVASAACWQISWEAGTLFLERHFFPPNVFKYYICQCSERLKNYITHIYLKGDINFSSLTNSMCMARKGKYLCMFFLVKWSFRCYIDKVHLTEKWFITIIMKIWETELINSSPYPVKSCWQGQQCSSHRVLLWAGAVLWVKQQGISQSRAGHSRRHVTHLFFFFNGSPKTTFPTERSHIPEGKLG